LKVALITAYEMGHQPLHLASPGAALLAAGHEVKCFDTSVSPLDDAAIEWPDAVAISVPMHTAMRLGIELAKLLGSKREGLAVCMYGLYATVGSDETLGSVADHLIAGEYERGLVSWVDGLDATTGSVGTGGVLVDLGRSGSTKPDRSLVPSLDNYARLDHDSRQSLSGYVEASHGCRYRCRHCPVPIIYDGRIRIVDPDDVVADVAALVEAGARHITFGDPDFFNAVPHSMKIVESVHARFPDLTFDCTIKVENLLKHRSAIPRLAAAGCLFVISALESTSDVVLEKLQKGHTSVESVEAIRLLRHHGIEMRPSFLPFTPWTALTDLVDLCHFIMENDLVGNVDPVQLTIRLLLPQGSLLLEDLHLSESLGEYDHERLSFPWASPDPAVDHLQESLASVLEKQTADAAPNHEIFAAMWSLIHESAGLPFNPPDLSDGSIVGRPRMTEPWFC